MLAGVPQLTRTCACRLRAHTAPCCVAFTARSRACSRAGLRRRHAVQTVSVRRCRGQSGLPARGEWTRVHTHTHTDTHSMEGASGHTHARRRRHAPRPGATRSARRPCWPSRPGGGSWPVWSPVWSTRLRLLCGPRFFPAMPAVGGVGRRASGKRCGADLQTRLGPECGLRAPGWLPRPPRPPGAPSSPSPASSRRPKCASPCSAGVSVKKQEGRRNGLGHLGPRARREGVGGADRAWRGPRSTRPSGAAVRLVPGPLKVPAA